MKLKKKKKKKFVWQKSEEKCLSSVTSRQSQKPLKKSFQKSTKKEGAVSQWESERERERGIEMEAKIEGGGGEEEANKRKWKRKKSTEASFCPISSLDDGCLMHIFSFLSPIPGTPFHPSASISLLLLISIQNQHVSFNGYHLILFLIVNSKNPIFNFNQDHFSLGGLIHLCVAFADYDGKCSIFSLTTTDILEYMHKVLWLTICPIQFLLNLNNIDKIREDMGFKSM